MRLSLVLNLSSPIYGREILEIVSAKSLLNWPTCASVTVLEVRSGSVLGVGIAVIAALALALVRGPEKLPTALQPLLSMPEKLTAI